MKKNEYIRILSKNIKFIRISNKLSKKKMCEILNTSQKSLNKLENGILPPRLSADFLYSIQENFDIPVCVLIEKTLYNNQ